MSHRKWLVVGLTAVFGLLLLSMNVIATESYQLSWWSVDGGSYHSSSESYQVMGTTGQPDAITVESANFELTGGFWAYPVSNDVPPPTYQRYLPIISKQ